MSNRSKVLLTGIAMLSASLLLASCAASPSKTGGSPEALDRSKQFVTVLTGPTSGVYYPVGGAFATALSDAGYKTSAQATGATAENVKALLAGDGEIAIAMADAAVQAYNGTEAFDGEQPATQLRSMMGLWPNVCQIVTTQNSGIKSFADLKGKRVGVGAPNSGVEVNARMIFAAHDMTYDDSAVDYLDYGTAIEQIKNGQMDAAFVTSAVGNATIKELGVAKTLAFVPVEGAALTKLTTDYPYYVETTIPADAYGTADDVTTAAVMNIMLVHQDISDEVVKDMLELFYAEEGLKTIGMSHATAEENIKLETALRGISAIDVPLHPGAAAFYASKGVTAD